MANALRDHRDRIERSHREEVERGEHDGHCEFLCRPGSYLCHCSKRRREAAGHTTPPGELIWQSPLCPRCYEEVEHDGDSWSCETCSVEWDSRGDNAEFTDDYGDLSAESAWPEMRPSSAPAVVDVQLPEPSAEVERQADEQPEPEAKPREWRDREGDLWRDADADQVVLIECKGRLPETAVGPHSRAVVERSWGPLTEILGGDA